MKRLIPAWMLAVCLIVTLAACSGDATPTGAPTAGEEAGGPASPPAQETAAIAEPGAADLSEYVTFSMNTTAEPPGPNDALWNYYTDKFNFDVDWVPFQFAERWEKTRIWIATDDLPDIFWVGLDEMIFAEYITWMKTGLFSEIPDLSPYPNIQGMYNHEENMVADILCTFDGKLMSLPAIRATAPYDYMVNLSFGYRADWAEKLNMRSPDDTYTWDEFWNLLQAFIEQDPGGNGPGNTYGISTRLTYFPDIMGIWQTDPSPWTWEDPTFVAMDGEYVWYPATDTYVEGLKIVKDLYDRGIIWPDQLVDVTENLYRELYYAGQMGAMAQNNELGFVSDTRNRVLEVDPSLDRSKVYVIAHVSMPGQDGQYYQHSMSCYWSAVTFSAKATDAQKQRFLQTQDYNKTEEGTRLAMYGVEGVDYTMDGGTITLPWEKDSSGTFVDPYKFREYYGRLGLNDGAAGLSNVAKNEEDRAHVQAAFEWNMQNVARLKVMDYVQVYTPLESKERVGTFTADVKNKAVDVIANSTSATIESDWRAWIAEMAPRVQPVLDELNALEYIPSNPIEMMEFVKSGGIKK